MTRLMRLIAAAGIGLCGLIQTAAAQTTIKVAIGQKDNWENQAAQLGVDAGIFKKHGLDLDVLATQGGGETLQAVVSGSVDVGIGAGTLGSMSAFQKGAPVRAIANATTGSGDVYFYVLADSPIKSLKDVTDTTSIAYSTNGSSTHNMVLEFQKVFNPKAKIVAAGGPAATLTQILTKQIDVGWSSPPFGLAEVEDGKIRIVGRGSDAPSTRNTTIRVQIANAQSIDGKKDAMQRFMKAYRESLDYMYSDPKALELYAAKLKIPVARAKKARDDFYPKDALDPDRLSGIDQMMADAVSTKFLSQPLTPEQQKTFFAFGMGK